MPEQRVQRNLVILALIGGGLCCVFFIALYCMTGGRSIYLHLGNALEQPVTITLSNSNERPLNLLTLQTPRPEGSLFIDLPTIDTPFTLTASSKSRASTCIVEKAQRGCYLEVWLSKQGLDCDKNCDRMF